MGVMEHVEKAYRRAKGCTAIAAAPFLYTLYLFYHEPVLLFGAYLSLMAGGAILSSAYNMRGDCEKKMGIRKIVKIPEVGTRYKKLL